MICPICDEQATKVDSWVMDGWCLMDESYKCGNHYQYNYDTGYTTEYINGHEFSWGYSSPLSRFGEWRRKLVIKLARMRLEQK